MRRTEIKRRTISIPALNLNYYGGIIESIDIYGIRYTRDLDLDVLRVKIDDLKEENAELMETLNDTESRFIAEWNRACNAERDNEKLRNLAKELYESAYLEYPSAFEHTYAERLRELGVEV